MKYLPHILLILLVVFLVWIYFDKESGHDQAMKRLIEKHQDAMDSMKVLVIKSDSTGYFSYKYCQESFNKMVGEMRHWKNRARKCELGQ